jgi:tRNA pseudouridine55 synthase
LAADIGAALGGSGHLRSLRRTAVGSFTLAGAVPFTELTTDHVLPPAAAVGHLPVVEVDDSLVAAVGHGKILASETLAARGPGPWAVLDEAGTLLAVYEAHRPGTVKPAVVLAPAVR